MLEVRNLTVRYGSSTIVNDVSFDVARGEWLMLVGPNGAGKSTIVNAISKGIPYTGTVLFEGKDISVYKPIELARRIGVLAQGQGVGYSFTVGEVVRLGRYAHKKGFFSSGCDDDTSVRRALEITGLTEIVNQSLLTLSGGELQRTFLAQVFAQNPQLLILDEPTNHLDLVYQKQVFELICNWVKEPNRAVISVVHDLDLAKCYGSQSLLLDRGRIVDLGKTEAVLSQDNLKKVYSMDVYGWMRERLARWSD